jgi:hypothetical protein
LRASIDMLQESWSYRNYVPKAIPENLKGLSPEAKQDLLDKWAEAVYTQNVQSSDDKLRNIRDLQRIHLESVPIWVMDRFKEVLDHYVSGQWLSTIALAGIIAEFVSFHLLEEYVKANGIRGLIKCSRRLGNQESRLKVLKELRAITETERLQLESIRTTRNEYIHLDKIAKSERNIRTDALEAVSKLTVFLNGHKLSRG